MKKDLDFKDTITVNLDQLPQLETIDIGNYNKTINIVGNGVNTSFKQIESNSYTISDNLLLLALQSYPGVEINYDENA